MKRIAVSLLLAGVALAAGCRDDRLVPLPLRASGGHQVAGAVRATSPHYRLIGTLGPAGGLRGMGPTSLHDGAFVNGR